MIEQYDKFAELWFVQRPGRTYSAPEVYNALISGERAQCLLRISRTRDIKRFSDENGRTILSWASEKGWEEVVNASLRMGTDVDLADNKGTTPLTYAARHGRIDIVRNLTYNQASVKLTDSKKRTPLSHASEMGHFRIMEILLHGASVDVDDIDDSKRSPLHWAVAGCAKSSIELLLRKKANIEACDEQGQTPYALALAENCIDIAQYLLKKGAKPIQYSNSKVSKTGDMVTSSPYLSGEELSEVDEDSGKVSDSHSSGISDTIP